MITAFSEAASTMNDGIARRPPSEVMTLERLGCAFPTRLSFMPTLVRRMCRERWRIEVTEDGLDSEGYGHRVYTAAGPVRSYSLVCFSQRLDPDERNDRVIAEAWDATFALFDGVPNAADLERLQANVPRQEMGRFLASELVLSRANRSVRMFDHVVARLAAGMQPNRELVWSVGYLFRTTAVYGNGKFGVADRETYDDRAELGGPFQAEFITVYLIRLFTLDLVEHIARGRAGSKAAVLAPDIRRFLGIGNSTGLGMAPFLVNHPELINNWIAAREEALVRVRAFEKPAADRTTRFRRSIAQAQHHLLQWLVEDRLEHERIVQAGADLADLAMWLDDQPASADHWNAIYQRSQLYQIYTQELIVSLLLDPHGDLVDELARGMAVSSPSCYEPAMQVGALLDLIEVHYPWALTIDFSKQDAMQHFWYVSAEKQEPRLGNRFTEAGAELELPFTVAHQVQSLRNAITAAPAHLPIGAILVARPELIDIAWRVQRAASHPYGEINANLVAADCQPLDILRCKLAFFGAGKFDPKSEKWLRIALFQGAPMPEDIAEGSGEDWLFASLPST